MVIRGLLLMCFVLGLMVGIHPSGVRADITIVDGPPKSEQLLHDWYESHIPLPYQATGILIVHEMDEAGMVAYLTQKSGSQSSHAARTIDAKDAADVDGVYDSDPARIAIEINDDGSIDTFTFAHEYGHYVWFNLMSKQDRKDFNDIYKRDKASGHLVTDYAGVSVEEGFAEAFSFYANVAPILQRREPDAYDFMSEWKAK